MHPLLQHSAARPHFWQTDINSDLWLQLVQVFRPHVLPPPPCRSSGTSIVNSPCTGSPAAPRPPLLLSANLTSGSPSSLLLSLLLLPWPDAIPLSQDGLPLLPSVLSLCLSLTSCSSPLTLPCNSSTFIVTVCSRVTQFPGEDQRTTE